MSGAGEVAEPCLSVVPLEASIALSNGPRSLLHYLQLVLWSLQANTSLSEALLVLHLRQRLASPAGEPVAITTRKEND